MSTAAPRPNKNKAPNLAGQVRHTSMQNAFKAIENTMGELHIQQVMKAKAERAGR